jgi:AcrR family transcriptional regulator
MSERLSADDWVKTGLKALAREGFTALKADLLAKSLGISRGSFYWHFADIGAFQKAVLERWRDITVEAVIAEIDRAAGGERLRSLLRRAFTADAALEIAVRAWAVSDPGARKMVETVDQRRLAYLEKLLASAGIGTATSVARAHILYWTYLGFALSGRKIARARLRPLLAELAALGEAGRQVKSRANSR